jgi:hypothetical protein
MKKICLLIFFILIINTVFSQDSIKQFQHVFGIETQFTYNNPRPASYHPGYSKYILPGYCAFYKFIITNKKNKGVALSCGIFERKAFGTLSYSGTSFSDYSSGNYEIRRVKIGVSYLRYLGKKKNFNYGFGIEYGRKTFLNGQFTRSYSSRSNPNTYYELKNASDYLNNSYLAFNFEISQTFKLSKRHYLVIGFKQYFQTSDLGDSGTLYTSSIYLAYNYR